MSFQSVHVTQKIFRALVDCSAFPGRISHLSESVEKLDWDLPFSKSTALLCLTLLDGEVGFYSSREEVNRSVSQLTYARPVKLDKADFILTLGEDPELYFEEGQKGTLIDPHQGATMIMEVDELSEQVNLNQDDLYELSGPGIESSKTVKISTAYDWMIPRSHGNSEFPLGMDIYFLDRRHNLMILPRTTRIRRIL